MRDLACRAQAELFHRVFSDHCSDITSEALGVTSYLVSLWAIAMAFHTCVEAPCLRLLLGVVKGFAERPGGAEPEGK